MTRIGHIILGYRRAGLPSEVVLYCLNKGFCNTGCRDMKRPGNGQLTVSSVGGRATFEIDDESPAQVPCGGITGA